MLQPNNRMRLLIFSLCQRKKKSFNTKAVVTCKRFASVLKKLTSKTKKQTEAAQGFVSPAHFVVATENTFNTRSHPNCSTSNDKKFNFPTEPKPGMCQLCYLCSHTCMHRLCKEGRKIGTVMMRRVTNKRRKQDPESRIKNKTLFMWVFDCDVQDTLLFLIVIISMIHDLRSFMLL